MMLLTLASPHLRSADVKKAQALLSKNVFGKDFKPGAVDGAFGESTARACIRAKYWLGYPKRLQVASYGEELDGYLSGTRLPAAYKLRAKQRVNAAPKVSIGLRALAEARKYVGKKENPKGSNKQMFGAWYGANGVPWCAEFVSYCFAQVGSKAFLKGKRYAYVPYVVHDARAGVNDLAVTTDPLSGDLVCFDWEGTGVADHIGLFVKWVTKDTFDTIEGNTAIGNDSNGGEVMKRVRKRSQVQAFVHVAR